jgi:hypothetical protein
MPNRFLCFVDNHPGYHKIPRSQTSSNDHNYLNYHQVYGDPSRCGVRHLACDYANKYRSSNSNFARHSLIRNHPLPYPSSELGDSSDCNLSDDLVLYLRFADDADQLCVGSIGFLENYLLNQASEHWIHYNPTWLYGGGHFSTYLGNIW